MKKEYLYWTDKQWEALRRMVGLNGSLDVSLSIGKVRLSKVSSHYELEYPTHIVTLKKDVPPSNTDLTYLRYMYNEYMSI